jgi:hypothetical protein
MKDLFGNTIPECERPKHGRWAHAAPVGTGPATETCGTCDHVRSTGHDGRYKKCWKIGIKNWTNGPGSDLRLKDKACSFWEPAKPKGVK